MKKSELRQIIKEEIIKLKKNSIQEYLVRNGSKIKDLLNLNLFEDMSKEDKLSKVYEDFKSDRNWMNIENKYSVIANNLRKQLSPFFKEPIPPNFINKFEYSWYDGSDAYNNPGMACEHLPKIYNTQIDLLEKLLQEIKK